MKKRIDKQLQRGEKDEIEKIVFASFKSKNGHVNWGSSAAKMALDRQVLLEDQIMDKQEFPRARGILMNMKNENLGSERSVAWNMCKVTALNQKLTSKAKHRILRAN